MRTNETLGHAVSRWRAAVHLGRACSRAIAPVAVSAFVVAAANVVHVAEARADEQVKVGASLQAVADVSLDEATIAKGSKVSVSAKKVVNGRVFVDVALADGHVVRAVPLPEIQKSFRVVTS